LPGRDLIELAVWPGPSAHPGHQVTIGRIITEVDELRGIALRLAEADADAFTAVTGTRTLSSPPKKRRPAQTISVAGMVVDLAVALAAIGNPNVISDVAAAAEAARAACNRAASSSARSTQSRSASG
jgi:methenyltetrahydrofolate cyclohydrolase